MIYPYFSHFQVIIPPKTAPQPMRITCRYIRENALLHPPSLNEGEGNFYSIFSTFWATHHFYMRHFLINPYLICHSRYLH